jgi:hypothetical protein
MPKINSDLGPERLARETAGQVCRVIDSMGQAATGLSQGHPDVLRAASLFLAEVISGSRSSSHLGCPHAPEATSKHFQVGKS